MKILVVENNPKYLKEAEAYFAGLSNIETSFATNYESAKAALPNQDGALIDIFIPETKDVRLGKIGKELNEQFRKGLEARWSDSTINKYLIDHIKEEHKPSYWALERLARDIGCEVSDSEFLTFPIIKSSLNLLRSSLDPLEKRLKEKRARELEAFEKEKAIGHAPLGIIIAKEAEKLRIPFVFVTDGHHHGPIYDAFWAVFFEGKEPLVKFGYGKKDKDFWQAAYEMLVERQV